jgi:S-adenosylmethionine:tRNA ribosyltransferase-isomerase
MEYAQTVPTHPQSIRIEDFDYTLPEERIASFALEQRDASRLLLYRSGHISHSPFQSLPAYLPAGATLLFNDTRVIHARLRFELASGAPLEILCLEPLAPAEHQQNFSHSSPVRWKCLVGGNRKWKSGVVERALLTSNGPLLLRAKRIGKEGDAFAIEFEWEGSSLAFGELLAQAGMIPLPPYLKREQTATDELRYQTVYAREQGSVAAPTAGLHFTEEVFRDLEEQGIQRLFTTLHVGAGTFKPVKSATMAGHHMHEEHIYIRCTVIEQLLKCLEAGRPIIPVGTTSLRLLESLYWHGTSLASKATSSSNPHCRIGQWEPYGVEMKLSAAQALAAILESLHSQGKEVLEGQTQLIIAPGYTFRLAKGLITNFHQPRSTLLLIIAAMVGDDWRRIYHYALDNDFRFLSYGDSSLLLPFSPDGP